jgi:catechol 2,3-dioxygenase-like lactoylglutathione lyase family enzyme
VTRPALSGMHHVTLPVTDLEAGAAWYAAVLGAVRVPGLDHHDPVSGRYSLVLTVPGLNVPVQLRVAPKAAAATGEYDPVTLAVSDRAVLDQWAAHLDAAGVAHGAVIEARRGHTLGFHDPDGTFFRLYAEPAAE